jgi:tRNA A37 threonylcarbamoyladenosine dehydratase
MITRRNVARSALVFLGSFLSGSTAWLHPTSPSLLRALTLSSSSKLISDDTDVVDIQANDQYRLRFAGVGRLYETSSQSADKVLSRLRAATVAVVGLGGVGSWAAEALARSGVGSIVLIDCDDICISNTNRQLHALADTVGRFKIDVMRDRLLQINPECNVTLVHDFVDSGNVHDIVDGRWTAMLDAIDGSRGKSALLAACTDLKLPVVTCGAAAGRIDPISIRVDDLSLVEGDKLLASCRKELRKYHGFQEGLSFREKQVSKRKPKKFRIAAVYSTEVQKPAPIGSTHVSSLRICDSALGTACFVTGTIGFVAAGQVVEMISQAKLRPPMR